MKFIKKFLGTVLVVAILAGLGYAAYKSTHIEGDSTLKDAALQPVKGPGGDTYFAHSGITGEAKEEDAEGKTNYTISGAWLWNEELTPAPAFESVGAVEVATFGFTSAKKVDAQKYAIYYSGGEQVMLYYLGERMVDVYDGQYGWWDETMRFIDCGAETHTVSKEFYEWFTSNAKPAEKADYLKLMEAYVSEHESCQVSGYWMWNEYIMPCQYDEAVNPSGYVFVRLDGTIAGSGEFYCWFYRPDYDDGRKHIMIAQGDDVHVRWEECNFGWGNYSHRFLYLGEDPQTLPAAEYAYFIQNARPCSQEEYEEAAKNVEQNRGSTKLLAPGVGQWGTEFKCDLGTGDIVWEAHADFFSNGEYISTMSGLWDEETQTYIVRYGTKYSMSTVYTTQDGWKNDAFRTFEVSGEGFRIPSGGGVFINNCQFEPYETTDQRGNQ